MPRSAAAQDLDRPARAPRLGELLRAAGAVPPAAVDSALAARGIVPLGEALRRRGAVTGATIAGALAAQSRLPLADLEADPPDPVLSQGMDPRGLLRLGALPWRRQDGRLVIAIEGPDARARLLARRPALDGQVDFAVAERRAIEDAILALHGPALAEAARDRCPEAVSCRGWTRRSGAVLPVIALTLAAAALLAPLPRFLALLGWLALVNACTTALRAVALVESFRAGTDAPRRPPAGAPLPVISLLIPLFREDATLRQLIAALEASDYPRERLDAIFILEADDVATPIALARTRLPPWARVLTVPPDTLKTKPRAMNLALDFCRGDIVGIYDAEDRPEPDQLRRVAEHLAAAPPEVGCVQGYLDFYNPRQNWLARCFAVEYAIWFRVLLRGVQRLGMPLPLGGTTVFFRRRVLERVGAWDAHNVTEDADLGMRLARLGYRTEMVATTTYEEANCRPWPWVRQRSRWLKGYAMTWVTHMRAPVRLWRELGPAGFAGFQLLLLGGLTAYLATPLYWALWAGWLGFDLAVFASGPRWLWTAWFASMSLGQAVMAAVALRAVWARPRRHLIATVPLMFLYWPLGALAAWRAVTELFTRPFYWAKTDHGL
ncbi:glycosyltransferase [Rhodobacteraceae bacterium 2CG4]|uniref:Glycosyltransferase n=1 Tax=Halovulum marinum TaxID=2662447 RepID=A0A6L5YZX1_9RHOB|nr:glycosyltransferase family 2 protein [Halovulum marinum]MSU89821.1 glycosyltransferase [Halovulum marinum]